MTVAENTKGSGWYDPPVCVHRAAASTWKRNKKYRTKKSLNGITIRTMILPAMQRGNFQETRVLIEGVPIWMLQIALEKRYKQERPLIFTDWCGNRKEQVTTDGES